MRRRIGVGGPARSGHGAGDPARRGRGPARRGQHRADLGLDAAALADRPARREIGFVSTAARLVGALVAIPEMLDIGPPGAGLRLCHAVCCPLSVRPTGLGVGLALKEQRYISTGKTIRPMLLGPPFSVLCTGIRRSDGAIVPAI